MSIIATTSVGTSPSTANPPSLAFMKRTSGQLHKLSLRPLNATPAMKLHEKCFPLLELSGCLAAMRMSARCWRTRRSLSGKV